MAAGCSITSSLTCGTSCPDPVISSITIPSKNLVQLDLETASNLNYTLQYSVDPTTSAWQDISTVAGNGGVLKLYHENATSRGFYRIKVTQQ
ncbi:MAG TPA: hypothetical protein P5186_01320 [Candidatus Paceibacterota bacterium]|nr:hypothetical protein [Verrucomicrobiota bacterium]HRY46661.1 hypothetical protein [Candidatus Paceibacterota bacterium]HRZ99570.1 hypothetical protein [Candidatus Paceibacterota bacterium]